MDYSLKFALNEVVNVVEAYDTIHKNVGWKAIVKNIINLIIKLNFVAKEKIWLQQRSRRL